MQSGQTGTVCTHHLGSARIIIIYKGLAKTIYIRCIYGNLGREITKYTVYIYGSGQPYIYNLYNNYMCALLFVCNSLVRGMLLLCVPNPLTLRPCLLTKP